MGKKYLDTKGGTLESSILDVWKQAIAVTETNKNDKSDDGEGLDAVQPKAVKKKFKDRKDKDIDNDGDTDSSDEYLHKRRKAVGKAMATEGRQLKDKKKEMMISLKGKVKVIDKSDWEVYKKKGYIQAEDTGNLHLGTINQWTRQVKPPLPFHDLVDHKPRDGELMLFPSHLLHDVGPNNSVRHRINMAFNVEFPKETP